MSTVAQVNALLLRSRLNERILFQVFIHPDRDSNPNKPLLLDLVLAHIIKQRKSKQADPNLPPEFDEWITKLEKTRNATYRTFALLLWMLYSPMFRESITKHEPVGFADKFLVVLRKAMEHSVFGLKVECGAYVFAEDSEVERSVGYAVDVIRRYYVLRC